MAWSLPLNPSATSTTSSKRELSCSRSIATLSTASSATGFISHGLVYDVPEPVPTNRNVRAAIGIPRPVDDHRAPLDVAVIDEAPKPAVIAAVAVITHHEDLALGHHGRPV